MRQVNFSVGKLNTCNIDISVVKTNDSIRRLLSDKAEDKAADIVKIPCKYLEESAQITGRNPSNECFYCA